eukprot:GHVT01004174.1.p1 GENE.GHVT01004174.1~~GHVT01004174.1.p1  ORF type:complete len:180 (-),score=13.92 GHVT01004174.1:29-568(-)
MDDFSTAAQPSGESVPDNAPAAPLDVEISHDGEPQASISLSLPPMASTRASASTEASREIGLTQPDSTTPSASVAPANSKPSTPPLTEAVRTARLHRLEDRVTQFAAELESLLPQLQQGYRASISEKTRYANYYAVDLKRSVTPNRPQTLRTNKPISETVTPAGVCQSCLHTEKYIIVT